MYIEYIICVVHIVIVFSTVLISGRGREMSHITVVTETGLVPLLFSYVLNDIHVLASGAADRPCARAYTYRCGVGIELFLNK